MLVLGLPGSLRSDSHNRRLLATASTELPAGVEFEVWQGLEGIPPYNGDADVAPAPAPVGELRATLARVDAVLIATPEYNHSLPGQLKNALDWASRPFPANSLRGKPVAVVGASTSMFGAVWAQAELRKVLGAIGAGVVDRDLPVAAAHQAFDDDGRLLAMGHQDGLTEVVQALVEEARERVRVAA